MPRNKGLKSAVGKYLLFVDNDDGFTKTAMEELFQAAEKFQADVLHCGKFFEVKGDDKISTKENLKEGSYKTTIHVDRPLFLSNDLAERVKFFNAGKLQTSPWNYLFRRELIVNNGLEFPKIIHGEDHVFDFFVLCKAKTFVLIPNIFYVYRWRTDSWSNNNSLSVEKHVHWYGSNFKAIELLDNFMDEFEVFQNNPELKYMTFEFFTSLNAGNRLFPLYAQIPAAQLDSLIRRELADVDEETAVTAFLFSRMAFIQMQLMQAQNVIKQQQNKIAELQRQV